METIIEKIAKLFALAGNNSCEKEVAAALAKANDLLGKYNLSMSDVDTHIKTKAEQDGGKRRKLPRTSSSIRTGFYRWQLGIWSAVCQMNFCYMFTSIRYVQQKNGKYVRQKFSFIIGQEHNVIATTTMAKWLQQCVEDFSMEWVGDNKLRCSREAISWKEGCASRLINRIQEIIDQKRREENTTTALAIYQGNEQDDNRDYVINEMNVHLVARKQSKHDVDWASYYAGQKRGDTISLDKVIGN